MLLVSDLQSMALQYVLQMLTFQQLKRMKVYPNFYKEFLNRIVICNIKNMNFKIMKFKLFKVTLAQMKELNILMIISGPMECYTQKITI